MEDTSDTYPTDTKLDKNVEHISLHFNNAQTRLQNTL